MIVEIKPIEKDKWHGYKDADNFSRPIAIFPAVDHDAMKYKTGLNEDDIAKLKSMGLNRDFSDDWKRYQEHPFWDSTEVKLKLKQHTFRLNTDNPLDFVKYKYALEHPAVANSLKEYEEGKWPDATHYIVNSPDVVKMKAKITEVRKKAFALMAKADRQTKVKIALLLAGKEMSKASDNELEVLMDELLYSKPTAVYDILSKNDSLSDGMYIVKKAIKRGVLRKTPAGIKFMDMLLGVNEEDAALFLGREDSEALREKIEEQIK